MNINQRLSALRQQMQREHIDAYIIPSSDPHQGEYVATHWLSRAWISGFTGSTGTAIITMDHAGIWTDSRYFIQAEKELQSSDFVLHKLTIPHTPEHLDWLVNNLASGSTVGFDGALFSLGQVRQMTKLFYTKKLNINSNSDLVQKAWTDRPALPNNRIFELDLKYAGQSRQIKLKAIRDKILQQKCSHHLVTTLDDIAWIFNIRSNDVDCNPVSIAYAVIHLNSAILYIDAKKVAPELIEKFKSENIFIKDYNALIPFLQNLQASEKIIIDPSRINLQLYNAIPEACIEKGTTISTYLKAIKNPVEVSNIRNAMLKDGVALTKLYRWLDQALDKGGVTEVAVAQQLDEFRRAQGDYYGESFAAIVGYKGNGAIVHYRAEANSCATIEKDGILLLDSGGQYLQGTTDITRTTALSKPTELQMRNFTLVLKGHIGLATLKFPEGTRGNQIEILARQHLWQEGLNYGHGTGHGVGYFLNVHEGPQTIGSGAGGKAATPFAVGMFTSNEPGFYQEGEYGIRIENLILTVQAEKTAYGQFLAFETMTLFPIDLNLIDKSLLTSTEIDWLNAYHQKVYDALAPLLDKEEQTWMAEQCRPLIQ